MKPHLHQRALLEMIRIETRKLASKHKLRFRSKYDFKKSANVDALVSFMYRQDDRPGDSFGLVTLVSTERFIVHATWSHDEKFRRIMERGDKVHSWRVDVDAADPIACESSLTEYVLRLKAEIDRWRQLVESAERAYLSNRCNVEEQQRCDIRDKQLDRLRCQYVKNLGFMWW